jgi:hypothetical protein
MSSSSGASVSTDGRGSAANQSDGFPQRHTPEVLHQLLILSDVVHGHFRLRVPCREIVFTTTDGAEQGSERRSKG